MKKLLLLRVKLGFILFKPFLKLLPLCCDVMICSKCKSPAQLAVYKYDNGVQYKGYKCLECDYKRYYKEIKLKHRPNVVFKK